MPGPARSTPERSPAHFDPVASAYSRGRPVYPDSLHAWLASRLRRRLLAWDCATGSGQAATGLAQYFDVVVATDASAQQIARARPHPRIRYRVAPAEASGLAAASVDLVTVAQALHWFDVDAFHREARRVLRRGGLLAEWTYGTLQLDDPAVDRCVQHFYHDVVGPWWPPERRHVEDGYARLPFPFRRIDAPAFAMSARYDLDGLLTYLRSWSASARFEAERGQDPVALLHKELAPLWGDPARRLSIRWPLSLRVGRA